MSTKARLAGLLVGLATLQVATVDVAGAETVRSRVGISIYWPEKQSERTISVDVAMAKSLGVGYIRTDLSWDTVEVEKGRYLWTVFDARARVVRGANMKLLAILDYNHPLYASAWSAGFYSEANIVAYRNFAVAAVKRYHGPMVSFELYNEPNQNEYWEVPPAGQPSKPTQYMNLVKATLPAIKAAVSDAVVMAPGLGHNPTGPNAPWANELLEFPYLKTALDLGLLSYTSTISVHPYPDQSQPPENTLATTYAALRSLIGQYPSAGPVSIFNSESGYSTKPAPGGITLAQQRQWLPRHVLLDIYLNAASTTLFTLRDMPGDSMNFGLVQADGRKKPAFHSVQRLLREIGDLKFTRRLPGADNDWLLEFRGGGRTVVAGWTTGAPHAVGVSDQKTMWLSGDVSYLRISDPGGTP